MGDRDMARLKADASGNTALSERLAEAARDFCGPQDAVNFLTARGFAVSALDLRKAAALEAADRPGPVGAGEGGYGALLRFFARR